jgi:hypothetical protein
LLVSSHGTKTKIQHFAKLGKKKSNEGEYGNVFFQDDNGIKIETLIGITALLKQHFAVLPSLCSFAIPI